MSKTDTTPKTALPVPVRVARSAGPWALCAPGGDVAAFIQTRLGALAKTGCACPAASVARALNKSNQAAGKGNEPAPIQGGVWDRYTVASVYGVSLDPIARS